MSKLSYSLTMRILEVLPRVIDPEPNVLNSALIEHPSATLPPLDLIIPREKSLFDQLLEGQENRRIGNHCEFDYVAVTTQSPLHRTPSQQTPAWIVTHMGIEGEGKVSEWARLEPGMGVRLFDEALGEKNYGFEKVWLFGIIRVSHRYTMGRQFEHRTCNRGYRTRHGYGYTPNRNFHGLRRNLRCHSYPRVLLQKRYTTTDKMATTTQLLQQYHHPNQIARVSSWNSP